MTIDQLKTLRASLINAKHEIEGDWTGLGLDIEESFLNDSLADLVTKLDEVIGNVNQSIGELV